MRLRCIRKPVWQLSLHYVLVVDSSNRLHLLPVTRALLSTSLEHVENRVRTIAACKLASSSRGVICSRRAVPGRQLTYHRFTITFDLKPSFGFLKINACRRLFHCAEVLVLCSSLLDAHFLPNFILDTSGFHIWPHYKHLLISLA